MRYHYEKPDTYSSLYGTVHRCNHSVYTEYTLFKINQNGLAVIQQRYNPDDKTTYWGGVDPWIVDELYLHKNFGPFFNERSGKARDELYPTGSIRQIMWALRMKPLPKERWETCFDRKII